MQTVDYVKHYNKASVIKILETLLSLVKIHHYLIYLQMGVVIFSLPEASNAETYSLF